jgi:putative oxidoreductase
LLQVISGDFSFGDPIGLGATTSKLLVILAEVICPLFIILGFKTRLAAIPPIIAMSVAAFVAHAGDAFSTKEKALLFAVAFMVLLLTGAGKFSIDKK